MNAHLWTLQGCKHELGRFGDDLLKRIGPENFWSWCVNGQVAFVGQTGKCVTLSARSSYFAREIKFRFRRQILACCADATELRVIVTTSKNQNSKQETNHDDQFTKSRQNSFEESWR